MRIINYCVDVVDSGMQERLKGVQGTEAGLDAQPSVRSKLYTDEVLVRSALGFLPDQMLMFGVHRDHSGIRSTTKSPSRK